MAIGKGDPERIAIEFVKGLDFPQIARKGTTGASIGLSQKYFDSFPIALKARLMRDLIIPKRDDALLYGLLGPLAAWAEFDVSNLFWFSCWQRHGVSILVDNQ